MKKILSWVKKHVETPEEPSEYVEIEHARPQPKVKVRTFHLESFDDTKAIISVMREGTTIALIDVSPLREKDVIDLKRSVNKLKNACAEIGCSIAGLSGDWIVIAPSYAEIYKPKPKEEEKEEEQSAA